MRLPGRVRRMESGLVDRLLHLRVRCADLHLRRDPGFRPQGTGCGQSVGTRCNDAGMDAVVAAAVPSVRSSAARPVTAPVHYGSGSHRRAIDHADIDV
jgi:hypothetical protein